MTTERPVEPVVEPSVDWRRVARGLHWIGFGVFLLLTTLGILPWSFWLRAAEFWPVLLIGLGLRMMLARRVPALALVSPLVIHGTLALLALSGDRGWGSLDWKPVNVTRGEAAERWLLDGELAFTHIDIRAADLEPALLATGRAMVLGDGEPVTMSGEAVPRVLLAVPQDEWRFIVGRPPRQAYELEVAAALPMRLDLESAFTWGTIDLSQGSLSGAALDGAFNDTTLMLGAPREEVRVDYEGAFNNFEMVVPDEVPVSVSSDGFLNIVDGRPRRDRTGPGYRLRVDGAFNRIVIRAE